MLLAEYFVFLLIFLCSIRYHSARILNVVEEDEPLILTKYIETGDIEKARLLSRTGELPDAPAIESYSGFFTINKKYNSNIFFWFIPAMNNDKNAPVLLWLQGGPGVSGLFGFFVEHGPYEIQADQTARLREYHWAKTFQVIYVDNPVGTGFSFTDDDRGYVTNQEEMADGMYEFLQQFFTIFYEYKKNDFYVTGESYAGKYVPSVTHKIHQMGNESNINLKGMAIGNGMCDPETMMNYSDYLYSIGLVDKRQASAMRNLSKSIVKHIQSKEFYDAVVEMDKLIINFQIFPYISLFKNFTGFDFYYNFLNSKTPQDFPYYQSYIKLPQFREAMHVGNRPFLNGTVCQKHLLMDIMQSVKPAITTLMNSNYRIMFYNGQLDVIIPYILTLEFLSTVNWKLAEEYKNAERRIWRINGEIAGYVHNVGNFYEVLVRNAGHILPHDQPEVALDLITRFINNKPFK